MPKILLAGEICAEKQYLMDSVPHANEVGFVNSVNTLTSSKIINAGRVLASSNSVSMFGVVGNDNNGKQAISDLEKYGIDTKLVYTTSESPTAEVLVLTDKDGQSAIVLNLNAINFFDESKLQNLSGYEYLYMATSMKLDQIYKMIERANKDNVKVFLDFPNQQKEFDKEKLKTVDFVVPNRQEAELLLDIKITTIYEALEAVTKLKSFTDGIAIITLDTDGCVVFDKEPKHYPTETITAVDATGSGDIFRGVFLSEYIKTNDLDQSIKKALQIATESVKYQGVDNSIEEIKKLI
ncbi:MAG: PfkB family carbohydrate kinase [bacterium]|nr:MAG: PfkB family carbohydrate kinase [bacterium]